MKVMFRVNAKRGMAYENPLHLVRCTYNKIYMVLQQMREGARMTKEITDNINWLYKVEWTGTKAEIGGMRYYFEIRPILTKAAPTPALR